MKLPTAWLKEFVDVKESPEKLAEIFTLLGAEVETMNGDILDLEITPNRPDWLSIYGLAREFAAFENRPLKRLSAGDLVYNQQSKLLDIEFANKNLIPRYSAIVFENIAIKPSSKKIQQRLKQFNINVHNNIIDITNYVMLEFGLPLHAFDLDEILGHKMLLRESEKGEKLETVDEKIHTLPEGSLVIEDAKRLIDLMGIKGGANSGIKDSTKRIFLQATVDNPKKIRMTSKKIGLSTEASYRFERGVDQQSTLAVLERAKQLILESCNAKIIEAIDITNVPTPQRSIELNHKRVSELLATKIDENFIIKSLARLGFGIKDWQVDVPSWRLHDVFYEEDLIEEIARMYGYDKLEKRVLKSPKSKLPAQTSPKFQMNYKNIQKLKHFLTQKGFTEVLTYSLVSKQEVTKGAPELEKPLSPETAYCRTSLAPGLIKTITRNPWVGEVSIFEVGQVFRSGNETEMVGLASTKKLPFDLEQETIIPEHPLGKLNKLRRTVYITELPVEEAFKKLGISLEIRNWKLEIIRKNYRPISNFPPAVRDIAIIVDHKVKTDAIVAAIKSLDDRILIAELFDEFTSDKFGVNKKSFAYHIVFDDPKRTLNEKEITKLMDKITKLLQNKFVAKLR